MKKVIIAIAAGLLLTAGFTSCKKEYTCSCTVEAMGVSQTTDSKLGKATKKDAKKACESSTTNFTAPGVSVSCKLK